MTLPLNLPTGCGHIILVCEGCGTVLMECRCPSTEHEKPKLPRGLCIDCQPKPPPTQEGEQA